MINIMNYYFSSSHVSFGVDSRHNIGRQAHVQLVSRHLYNQDSQHTPLAYGPLDKRMVDKYFDSSVHNIAKSSNINMYPLLI